MDKLDLIKMAITEWDRGELAACQALINIAVVIGVRDPSAECTEWAKKILIQEEKDEDNLQR